MFTLLIRDTFLSKGLKFSRDARKKMYEVLQFLSSSRPPGARDPVNVVGTTVRRILTLTRPLKEHCNIDIIHQVRLFQKRSILNNPAPSESRIPKVLAELFANVSKEASDFSEMVANKRVFPNLGMPVS